MSWYLDIKRLFSKYAGTRMASGGLWGDKTPDHVYADAREPPVFLSALGVQLWQFQPGLNQYLHMSYQMPHGWLPGTAVRPHVHYTPLTTPSGVIVWEWVIYHAPGGGGGVFSEGETIVRHADLTDTVAATTLVQPAGELDLGVGTRESHIMLMRLGRLGSDKADTYAGNAVYLSSDLHYKIEKVGTVHEHTS